jgi:hypothetical protein
MDAQGRQADRSNEVSRAAVGRAVKTIEQGEALAKPRDCVHLGAMAKTAQKSKSQKSAKKSRGPEVLGVTSEGVRILKPRGKATHFTAKEISEAVATVRVKNAG